ncbi:MAG: MDR family oxidoreductase [Kiloniellales bacterium]
MFKALVLEEAEGKVTASVQELAESRLPSYPDKGGTVTVAISHSTLNYKDGMILNGVGRLVRNYPHVPGIDFAGTVEASEHPDYRPGAPVLLTGWRVGELTWGGHAQKARVKGDWLVPRPEGLSPRHAMAIGTAGFTAMLAVMALEDQGLDRAMDPGSGEVLVTGAAGGVGSVAVALLAGLGHRVTASTGRAETHDYLRSLGAATILDRSALAEASQRPLEPERWIACVDAVGGTTLARVLAQCAYHASVAAVGLAGGSTLETTVLPFLLRGVKLLGIDSVLCPTPRRRAAWSRLAADLATEKLEAMIVETGLSDLPRLGAEILKGQVRGRVVVDVNA